MSDTKTPADVAAELQTALDAENADATTHAAAISAAIADLSALDTSGAAPTVQSVTVSFSDGSQQTVNA